MNAYEKLALTIKEDTKGNLCFNEDGCTLGGNCSHAYCDKLNWIKTRAKEYAEFLKVDWLQIIDAWESERNYWYMNYYQDSNQPKLNSNHVRLFDTLADFYISVGKKEFRCPNCGGITTDAYDCNSNVKINDRLCDWKVSFPDQICSY